MNWLYRHSSVTKTMFPNFFSCTLGVYSTLPPVLSLSIDQDISLRPCFSYAPNFCAPSLNLLFAVSVEKVSSHQYKDLRPFPIIMRKRKFFSHHHTSESLYLIPTFNPSLAKQSECSRFLFYSRYSSQHSAKVNFCTFSGVLNLLHEKSTFFTFAASSASNSLLSPHSPSYILLLTAFCLSKTYLPAHGDPVNGWYTADLFCCPVFIARLAQLPSRHEYFPTFFAAFQNGAANHKAHCINAWADFLFSDPCSCYLILPADSPLSNGSRRPTLSKQTIFMRSFLIRSLYQLLKKLPSYRKNLSALANLALPADPLCLPILTIKLFSYFATRPIVPSQILRLLAPPIHPWKIIMTLATLGSFPFANHDLFPFRFLF